MDRMDGPRQDPRPAAPEALAARSWCDLWRLKTALGQGSFVFSDLHTRALAWQLKQVPCDTRDDDFRLNLQGLIDKALAALPERDPPWVMQWFLSDESDFSLSGGDFCPDTAGDALRERWRQLLDAHLQRCRGGAFADRTTRSPWRLRRRAVRLFLYPASQTAKLTLEQGDDDGELDDAASRLGEALSLAGAQMQPLSGQACLAWLQGWLTGGQRAPTAWPDALAAIDACFRGSQHADLPLLALAGEPVRSHLESGCWQIGERWHRLLPLGNLTQEPAAGVLSAELNHPDGVRSFWDFMPAGAVLALSTVQMPSSQMRSRLAQVAQRARGPSAEAQAKRAACNGSLEALAQGQRIQSVAAGVYVSADSRQQIEERSRQVLAICAAEGLQLNPPRQDHLHLDSWCNLLPGNFDPAGDQRWFRRRARLWHGRYLSAMIPLYGRSTGTGTAGALFFNRGGEPLLCDPLSRRDRVRNAHSLIIGPTGSGKTALLIYLLLSMAARHRPRLFLVTTLPTFDLLGDFLASCGWSLHRVRLKASGGEPIPPFAGARRAASSGGHDEHANTDAGEEDTSEMAARDRISELELIASLMVSDQQGDLKHWQSDLLREAVMAAAERLDADPMVSDVVAQLRRGAEDSRLPEQHRQTVLEMASAMNRYTQGVAGAIFNRPGELWPEADCTILDLGIAGRRGYEHLRTLAYTSFVQRINDLIERRGNDSRQTLVVTDEAHVILGQPQLAAYLNSITAQWRTWGTWKWVVTQSLRQIPEASRSVLNMMEWWWCLGLDKDEVASVAAFKGLTAEESALLSSAHKEPGKYVEAVVMSDSLSSRFRAVLPALVLALAQTEKEEKAQRGALMAEMNLSELEAAFEISRRMEADSAPDDRDSDSNTPHRDQEETIHE